ncbi:MAG: hypothetical protein U0797_02740 [Gemmataceae bacterium]
MNHLYDCTLPEKILLPRRTWSEPGAPPFVPPMLLIVAVWQKCGPAVFGLKGFEDFYPDSNKVLAGVMGEKGLPRRGWMVKVGQKLYTLTRDGRQIVRKLLQGEDTPPLTAKRSAAKLSRDQDLLLQSLLASTAYTKLRQGREAEWTFSEACRFWSIGDRLGTAVDLKLDEIQRQLTEIERTLTAGPQTLGNGREVTAPEVGALCDLHHQLEQRFGRHLNLLRSRAERE